MQRPMFNAGKVFDVPTGKFKVAPEYQNLNEYCPPMSVHSKSNVGFYMYARLDELLRKTKGGTVERFTVAVKMFVLMGFIVKWDGTIKEPEVSWFDTEGWSNDIDVAEIIRNMLNKEYEPEDNRLAVELHESIKTADKETFITLDSYSELT